MITAAVEARRIRRAALPKAAKTVVDLLDHQSGSLRLAAAEALMSREEGRPHQSISVTTEDAGARSYREAVEVFLEHVRGTTPELEEAAAAWGDAIESGELAPRPAGLLPPVDGPARDVWNLLSAASVKVVEALP